MTDNLQEYLLFGLGVLLTIVPIIREVKSNKKSLGRIPYIGLIILISISIFYLGFQKVSRDRNNSNLTVRKIDLLIQQVNNISKIKERDSFQFKQFEVNLFDKFSIKRDSNTNKPIKVFNTTIQNAKVVNIGQN